MKTRLENLLSATDCKSLIIYSKNHYNVFKMLHKELKGEPYKGDNIPVLWFNHNGTKISVLSDDLDHNTNDNFNFDDFEEETWAGI